MSNKDKGGADEVTGFQLRETPIIESPVGSSPVAQPLAERETDELDRLGDLPHSYGSDTIFLIAQEPKWLFTYWDIDISRHPGGQAHLRVYRGDSELESEIEVPFETRNWYIPVKEAGSSYTVEIGYYRGQTWNTISRSVTVLTPPDKVSESESFDYASIPLHLSFQKLTDSIESAIRSGESLIEAISRLQREGHIASHVTPASFAELVGVQRALLESLLGAPLLEELTSGGLSSTEIDSRIRTYLEERLSSAGASEWFSSELLHSAGLSGLGLSSALSSGEVGSSWNIGALSSWASGALTSWVSAAGAGASWTPNRAGTSSPRRAGRLSRSGAGRRQPFPVGARLRSRAGCMHCSPVGSRPRKRAGFRRDNQAGRKPLSPVGCKKLRRAGCKPLRQAGHKRRNQAGAREPFPVGIRLHCRVGRQPRHQAGEVPRKR